MDEFKRSIYVEARRMIAEGEQEFVCRALQYALKDITGLGLKTLGVPLDDLLAEFFPEFFELHDGVYWSFDWEFTVEKVFSKHSAWWVYKWKEPRLAILDFIINNR